MLSAKRDGKATARLFCKVLKAQHTQIVHADASAGIMGTELAPGLDITSDAAIATYIRQSANTFWYPAGRCKMGTDPIAVIDSELRVHGVGGVRVVDASIRPTYHHRKYKRAQDRDWRKGSRFD
jgi:choline dehydrogenase-like flavoprotein